MVSGSTGGIWVIRWDPRCFAPLQEAVNLIEYFQTLRPQLATFNVTNGLLRNLKIIKPIAWGWNLPGQNIRVENHFVDAAPVNGTRSDTVVSASLSIVFS